MPRFVIYHIKIVKFVWFTFKFQSNIFFKKQQIKNWAKLIRIKTFTQNTNIINFNLKVIYIWNSHFRNAISQINFILI